MKKQTTNYMELGKVPPQAIELEEAVLGAIMVERNTFQLATQFLTPQSFYKDSHQRIFEAMFALDEKHEPIDMLTVIEQLRKKDCLDEVGGAVYIAGLTSKVGSGAHLEKHTKILFEKYARREMIRLSNELGNGMYDESEDLEQYIDLFDKQRSTIFSISKVDEKHIREAVSEMVEKSIRLKDGTEGIPTGFTYFDEFSGGIQLGDLIVLAGETSNGKTTLGINMLQNAAEEGIPCAIFSYEMTTFQLAARMVAYRKRISSKDIIRGEIDEMELRNLACNVTRLTNSPLYIIKPTGNSFGRLMSDIKRIHSTYKTKLILIDYLQLLSNLSKNGSTADMIADMANRLKALAVELGIAIIVVSQLSRMHGSTRPTLSRLKGSGDIENAADVVMFTYLPYKDGIISDTVNGQRVDVEENGIIIVAKGRNIGTTEFMLGFKKEVPGFYNHKPTQFPTPASSDQFFEKLANDPINRYDPTFDE